MHYLNDICRICLLLPVRCDIDRSRQYRLRMFILAASEVKMVEFVMDDEYVVEARDDVEGIDR